MSELIIVYTLRKQEVFYSTVKAHIWDVKTHRSLCGALNKDSHFNIWSNVASKVKGVPNEDERCKGCARKMDFAEVIPAWEQRMAEAAAAYEAKRQAEWFEADRIGHIAQDAMIDLVRMLKLPHMRDCRIVGDDRYGTVIVFTYKGVEITLGAVRTRAISGDA